MRERLNAIKSLRLANNPPLRQVDLARRIGVERGVISLYENGGREPSMRKAMQIARVFHVSVERVFYGVVEVIDLEQADHEVATESSAVSRAYGAGHGTPLSSRLDAENPHAVR